MYNRVMQFAFVFFFSFFLLQLHRDDRRESGTGDRDQFRRAVFDQSEGRGHRESRGVRVEIREQQQHVRDKSNGGGTYSGFHRDRSRQHVHRLRTIQSSVVQGECKSSRAGDVTCLMKISLNPDRGSGGWPSHEPVGIGAGHCLPKRR